MHQIVSDVLMGANVRDATEPLTRRRISLLNGALLATYGNLLKTGIRAEDIHTLAHEELTSGSVSDNDRIVLQWMLGTTKKQIQNVLRSDDDAWLTYLRTLESGLRESSAMSRKMYGDLELRVHDEEVSWDWALSMLMAIGAQTLATRGAEKSLYGKLFEKLVLSSVLSILGFRYSTEERISSRSFWLSSRGDKRESDATAIWNLGQGVRFDIGFIGVGNPEITLDKVSRFERIVEMGGTDYFLQYLHHRGPDRQGQPRPELAEQIGGTIIQMSANDWVKTLGEQLAQTLEDYRSPLTGLDHASYETAIREGVRQAPLASLIESGSESG